MIKKIKTMTQKTIKLIVAALAVFGSPIYLKAQEALPAAPAADTVQLDMNIILTVVAVFLLIPLYMSSKTFLFSVKHYVANKFKSDTNKSIIALIGFMLVSLSAMAQAADPAVAQAAIKQGFSSDFVTGVLLIVIVMEVLLIMMYSWQSNKFIKPSAEEKGQVEPTTEMGESWLARTWAKMNNFRTAEEESDIDTGHSYDGIRELDNVTPSWFSTTFYLCILWAIFYLYTHHVSKSEPLQIEEFNTEMAKAEEEKAIFLANQASNVDESTVKMLDASGIEKGKAIFTSKCAACHAANAASTPGGVGPNLTDNYWIHGGSIVDVFKTVKYGWPEKGMISWKDQLTPTQIAEVASYVLSTKGTVASGGKEPQGEEYKETAAVEMPTDSTAK